LCFMWPGPNAWEIEQNIRRAEIVALYVWMSGAAAICPHTMGRFYSGVVNEETFLDGDLELLRRSDGVVVVDPWQHSKGTLRELELARELDKPVIAVRPPPDGTSLATGLLDAFITKIIDRQKEQLEERLCMSEAPPIVPPGWYVHRTSQQEDDGGWVCSRDVAVVPSVMARAVRAQAWAIENDMRPPHEKRKAAP
jgi:nucleoside 2-deoxyribosyltransferase